MTRHTQFFKHKFSNEIIELARHPAGFLMGDRIVPISTLAIRWRPIARSSLGIHQEVP